MVLRKVGVFSCARVLGILYALLGVVIGALVSVVAMLGAAIGSAGVGSTEAVLGVVFGVAAIVVMPVLYGGMGFISGLIGAGLYNLVAGWAGGLEVEFQELTEPAPVP